MASFVRYAHSRQSFFFCIVIRDWAGRPYAIGIRYLCQIGYVLCVLVGYFIKYSHDFPKMKCPSVMLMLESLGSDNRT